MTLLHTQNIKLTNFDRQKTREEMKRDVRSWKPENPCLWLLGRRSWEDPQCPESNHLPAESHWPYLNHCRYHLKREKIFIKYWKKNTKRREDELRKDHHSTFIKWSSVYWRQNSRFRRLHGHVAVPAFTASKFSFSLPSVYLAPCYLNKDNK